MIFIKAWLLMLILGAIYSFTGLHWHTIQGHTVILALGYWWCLLIVFVAGVIFG